jgi:hypothetical protein
LSKISVGRCAKAVRVPQAVQSLRPARMRMPRACDGARGAPQQRLADAMAGAAAERSVRWRTDAGAAAA